MAQVVELKPGEVDLAAWRAVLAGAGVALDPSCRPAVRQGALAVQAIIAEDRVVYGVNTGFGKLASTRIAHADLETLQRNLVLSHATGTGAPLPDPIVRLVMAMKAASLARGYSGISEATLDHLLALLARGVLPVIPEKGSVGASGDLAPLAHMTAAMLGVGEARLAHQHGGRVWPAAEALAEAGIAPITLAAKEGLALLNGTQVSTALALAALIRIEGLFQTALITGAMSVDAARGSDAPFDARIHAIRGHKGQIAVAGAFRRLIEESAIRESHLDCGKVQDPYSLRCQPQVMGAILDQLRMAAGVLLIEANAVSDNPLVFADTGDVFSGGNFHAEPVALAADQIAIAISEIAAMAERRIAMLTDGSISGLPPFLVADPGLNSGFMIAHVTAAALACEIKQRAMPASVDSLPTSANQEDHVSMATHAARRLFAMADDLEAILAIELLAAGQGLDVHAPILTSPRLQKPHAALRAVVAPYVTDRYFAPDIAAARQLVAVGAITRDNADILPGLETPA